MKSQERSEPADHNCRPTKLMATVLLITPPYHCGVVEAAGTWLPLNLVYVAGSLRAAGHEVEIYDAMTKFDTHEDIARRIEDRRPDVVATGGFTAVVNDCLQLLETAKAVDADIITVLGGVHPTFCYQDMLKDHGDVDYVVRGEGEETFPELLECLAAGDDPGKVKGIAFRDGGEIVATPPRPFIQDLDVLPRAWSLVDWPDYTYRPTPDSTLAVVGFARGCVSACSFCSQQLFWEQTWRSRSPENFVAELAALKADYGVDVAMIADESPATDEKRWRRVIDLLIEADLGMEILLETRVVDVIRDENILDLYKQAGIVHIYVGVESGSQETLEKFNKQIKVEQSKKAIELINAAGIISETSFVLGMPDDTSESMKHTAKLAQFYNPDLAFFLAIAPWPYADIYEELKPYIEDWDLSHYNLVEPVIKPRNMTREQVSHELFKAFRNFYMKKMTQLPQMSKFKRDYMISVGQLLSKHSYLAGQMKMPDKIHQQLQNLIGSE